MDIIKKKEIYVFDEEKLEIGKPYAIYYMGKFRNYAILKSICEKELRFRIYEHGDIKSLYFEIGWIISGDCKIEELEVKK